VISGHPIVLLRHIPVSIHIVGRVGNVPPLLVPNPLRMGSELRIVVDSLVEQDGTKRELGGTVRKSILRVRSRVSKAISRARTIRIQV
jgi:hypothetical protein